MNVDSFEISKSVAPHHMAIHVEESFKPGYEHTYNVVAIVKMVSSDDEILHVSI